MALHNDTFSTRDDWMPDRPEMQLCFLNSSTAIPQSTLSGQLSNIPPRVSRVMAVEGTDDVFFSSHNSSRIFVSTKANRLTTLPIGGKCAGLNSISTFLLVRGTTLLILDRTTRRLFSMDFDLKSYDSAADGSSQLSLPSCKLLDEDVHGNNSIYEMAYLSTTDEVYFTRTSGEIGLQAAGAMIPGGGARLSGSAHNHSYPRGDEGTLSEATWGSPTHIVATDGLVYVYDEFDFVLRKLDSAKNIVTKVLGIYGSYDESITPCTRAAPCNSSLMVFSSLPLVTAMAASGDGSLVFMTVNQAPTWPVPMAGITSLVWAWNTKEASIVALTIAGTANAERVTMHEVSVAHPILSFADGNLYITDSEVSTTYTMRFVTLPNANRTFSFVFNADQQTSASYVSGGGVALSIPVASQTNQAEVSAFALRILHAANSSLFPDSKSFMQVRATVESKLDPTSGIAKTSGTCNTTHCTIPSFTIPNAKEDRAYVLSVCISTPVACKNMTVTIASHGPPTGLMVRRPVGNQVVLSSIAALEIFLSDDKAAFVPPTSFNKSNVDVVMAVEYPLSSGMFVTIGTAPFHNNRAEPLRPTNVPAQLQADLFHTPGVFVGLNFSVALSDGSFSMDTGGGGEGGGGSGSGSGGGGGGSDGEPASPTTMRCPTGAIFDPAPGLVPSDPTTTRFVVRGAAVSRLVDQLIATFPEYSAQQQQQNMDYMAMPAFQGGWMAAGGLYFSESTMRLLDHCSLEVNTTQTFSAETVPAPLLVHVTGHPFIPTETKLNETVLISDSLLRAQFSVVSFEQRGRRALPMCPSPYAQPRRAVIKGHAVAFLDSASNEVAIDFASVLFANDTSTSIAPQSATQKQHGLLPTSIDDGSIPATGGSYTASFATPIITENGVSEADLFINESSQLDFFFEEDAACCLAEPTAVAVSGCANHGASCSPPGPTTSHCECGVTSNFTLILDAAMIELVALSSLNGTSYSALSILSNLSAVFVGNASCNITGATPTSITFGQCDERYLPISPFSASATLLFNNTKFMVTEETFSFVLSNSSATSALVNPVVHSVHGCPLTVYPSTGRCVGDGSGLPVTIVGVRFNSSKVVTAVKFAHPVFPETSSVCEDLRMLNDTHLVCHYYRGFGSGFEVELIVAATAESFRTKAPTFSFRPSLAHLCPVSNFTGAKCGLGVCSPVIGQCNCSETNTTGAACDTCHIRNYGSYCSKECGKGPNGQVCSGNGKCDGLFGNGTCQCYKGFAGADCSITCQGGSLNPCSSHGTCSNIDGTCTCHRNSTAGYWSRAGCASCRTGYSGALCTLRCPRAADTTICGNQGVCANGACRCNTNYCGLACETSGAACTACPLPGRWGPSCENPCPSSEGIVCAGHGSCAEGMLGSGRCTCAAGYAGDSCQMLCPGGAASPCTGHGTCNVLSGVCACDQFWGNTSCNRQCPGANSSNVCSGHGTCLEGSLYSGDCECNFGYTGANCSAICPGGLTNPCSGHGSCDTTGCHCLDNDQSGHYAGVDCSVCAAGWYGTSCNLQCPKSTNGVQCSNHGTCDPLSIQCECSSTASDGFWRGNACQECQRGFWGSTCLDQCPGGYCNPCNGHGTCDSGVIGTGICTCDHSNTTGYWYGAECGDCDEDHYAANCSLRCPKDAIGTTCGAGVCSFGVEGSGACICDPHFTTSASTKACDTCLPGYFGGNCQHECPGGAGNTCSGHGACGDGMAGSGLCVCSLGYSQSDCSVYCPVFNNSNCGYGSCELNGTCTCFANYITTETGTCGDCAAQSYGRYCRQCPTCINGTCDDGITGSGTCLCNFGYWGSHCDQRCPLGQNGLVCGGHGSCTVNGTCSCDRNATAGYWTGVTCSACDSLYQSAGCTIACPLFNNEVCNGRGPCSNGQCLECKPLSSDLDSAYCGPKCELSGVSCLINNCPSGMWGTNCDQPCPTCTNGGLCLENSGECACPRGFGGGTCQTECPLSPADASMCSGFGTCSATGCACTNGHFGANCEFVCAGPTDAPCNNRGLCGPSGNCECNLGFSGSACEFACPGPESNPCFGKGSCGIDGSCECNGNFGGEDCGSCVQGVAGVDCDIKCYGVTLGKECICDTGTAGPSCDIQCPGRAAQDICSGNGVCHDGNTGTGKCSCVANYFLANCSQFCSTSACQTNEQMLNPSCDNNGRCQCQDNLIGHYAGARCDTCKTFFWGSTCALQCACNRHGGCDRDTGECQCFADDENGYWAGTECTECAKGYIGIDCRGLNIELSENPSDTSDIPVQNDVTGESVIFVDDAHNVTYVGGQPLVLLDSSTQPFTMYPEYLAGFNFNGTVVAMTFSPDRSSIVVTVEHRPPTSTGASVVNVTIFRISRGIPFTILSSQRLTSDLFTTTTSRRMSTLATTPGFSVVASHSGDNGETIMVLSNLKIVVTDAADSLVGVFDINGLSAVASATLSKLSGESSILVLSGTDSNDQWAVLTVPLPINTQPTSFAVFDNTTVTIPACTGATKCLSADLCGLERDGNPANDVIYCGVQSTDGPALIRIPYVAIPSAATPGTGSGNLLVATTSPLKFTALAFDHGINLGYITFHFSSLPSFLYKFSLQTLVPTGTYQFAYVGSDAQVVTSLMVIPENRELHCVIVLPFKTMVLSLNLFGVKTVRPHIMDSVGNLTVTVTGEGFSDFATPRCLFSHDVRSEVLATVVNSSFMTCVAPESNDGGGDCDYISFNIKFGTRRKTTTSNAPIMRPTSATLERLVTNFGGASGSTHTAVEITVRGYGFVSSPYARCRLLSDYDESASVVMTSTFINSTAIVCHQPRNLNVTRPPTRLAYAHDGATFSPSSLFFAVTGTASGIVGTVVEVAIMSDFVAKLPPIIIHVADENQNSLYNFDSNPYGQGPHPITGEFLLGSLTFLNASVKASGKTSDGVVVFDSLTVSKPKVGTYSMLFATPLAYRFTWLTAVKLTVTEGTPSGIEFLNGRDVTRSWTFGASTTIMIQPDILSIVDAAGNPIRDVLTVPSRMWVHYSNAYLRDPADENSEIFHQSYDSSTGVRVDGTYQFPELPTRGVFGGSYSISFAATGVAALTIPVSVELCQPGTEYGKLNSFSCLRCPDHGICDGTPIVDVENGYWRSAVDSFEFYDCAPPYSGDSCGKGTCNRGYEGPRCSVCEPDYGKTGLTCEECGTQAVNSVFIALVAIVIFGVLYLFVSKSIRPQKEFGMVQSEADVLPIIFKILANHLQVCSKVGDVFLEVPPELASLFAGQSQASSLDFSFSFVACEAKTNFYGTFVGTMLIPCAIVIFFAIVMVIRNKTKKRLSEADKIALRDEAEILFESHKKKEELFGEDDLEMHNFHAEQEFLEVMGISRPTDLAVDPSQVVLDDGEVSSDGSDWSNSPRSPVSAAKKTKNKIRVASPGSPGARPATAEEDTERHERHQKLMARLNVDDFIPEEDKEWSAVQVSLVTAIIVMFLFYQTIIETCGKMLQCDKLDLGIERGGAMSYLSIDRSIECYTPTHNSYSFMAMIIMGGVGLGLPILSILVVKFVAKATMNGDIAMARHLFFFMTGGYKPSLWFWESIIMSRKAVIVMITVIVTDMKLRNYCAMWAIGFYFVIHSKYDPFAIKLLTNLEMLSLLTILISLNVGASFDLFSRDSTPGPYWSATIGVLALNVITLLVFAVVLLRAAKNMVRHLYLRDPHGKLSFLSIIFRSPGDIQLESDEQTIHHIETEMQVMRNIIHSTRTPREGTIIEAIALLDSLTQEEYEREQERKKAKRAAALAASSPSPGTPESRQNKSTRSLKEVRLDVDLEDSGSRPGTGSSRKSNFSEDNKSQEEEDGDAEQQQLQRKRSMVALEAMQSATIVAKKKQADYNDEEDRRLNHRIYVVVAWEHARQTIRMRSQVNQVHPHDIEVLLAAERDILSALHTAQLKKAGADSRARRNRRR